MQREKSLIPKRSIGGTIDNIIDTITGNTVGRKVDRLLGNTVGNKVDDVVNEVKGTKQDTTNIKLPNNPAVLAVPSLIGASALSPLGILNGMIGGAINAPRGQMLSQVLRGALTGGLKGIKYGAIIPPILLALGMLTGAIKFDM